MTFKVAGEYALDTGKNKHDDNDFNPIHFCRHFKLNVMVGMFSDAVMNEVFNHIDNHIDQKRNDEQFHSHTLR